jgi:hypothetical protein
LLGHGGGGRLGLLLLLCGFLACGLDRLGQVFLRFREVLGGGLLVLVGSRGFDLLSGFRQIGRGRPLFL